MASGKQIQGRVTRAAIFRHAAGTTGAVVLSCTVLAPTLPAQDLDPRAYANVPVDTTLVVSGFAVSNGAMLSDPTLPVTDLHATVETPSLGIVRVFPLFGRTAQAFGAFPYSWAQASGKVFGEATERDYSGLSDMRLRVSVLVRGAPAATMREILAAPRRTILGTSLTVSMPTGEFYSSKLINIGTNRWGFKPEFAVSKPIGARWLLDTYAGVWLFTQNDSFFPGTSLRTQEPMAAFQAHLSYNFNRQLWAALDATFYVGGQTTVNGIENDDRQSNSRLGGTLVLPVATRHAVKLAVSKGAIVRYGADYTTYSFGWQTAWIPPVAPSPSQQP